MPRYEYRNERMLSVIGEALLNIGTAEYSLSTAIPILQDQLGLAVSVCYKGAGIPSLDRQKEACRLLHCKTSEIVSDNEQHYIEICNTLDYQNHSEIEDMFRFVQLADHAEGICLSLRLILRLVPELHKLRNDLMHSTKLESNEGLLVTTANESARLIPWRTLQCFGRKSRQISYLASMLTVSAVGANHGLEFSFGNDSYHSRFLLRYYRAGVKNLGSRWRHDLDTTLDGGSTATPNGDKTSSQRR